LGDIDITKLGFFLNGKFMLNKGDHKKLFTYFKDFYVHRVQFIGGCDPEHKPAKSVFDSYEPLKEVKEKPEISKKTSELAQKKRTKLLANADI
jgi:hypothetical protein